MNRKKIAVRIACCMIIYALLYACLSVRGRYEPEAIGLNGVKWYAWAPLGFVKDYRWRTVPCVLFYPLNRLDNRYWHTDCDMGNYPVNEVSRKDIWKVYKAWGAVDKKK